MFQHVAKIKAFKLIRMGPKCVDRLFRRIGVLTMGIITLGGNINVIAGFK